MSFPGLSSGLIALDFLARASSFFRPLPAFVASFLRHARQIPHRWPAQVLTKMHAPPKAADVPVISVSDLSTADGFLFGFGTRCAGTYQLLQRPRHRPLYLTPAAPPRAAAPQLRHHAGAGEGPLRRHGPAVGQGRPRRQTRGPLRRDQLAGRRAGGDGVQHDPVPRRARHGAQAVAQRADNDASRCCLGFDAALITGACCC